MLVFPFSHMSSLISGDRTWISMDRSWSQTGQGTNKRCPSSYWWARDGTEGSVGFGEMESCSSDTVRRQAILLCTSTSEFKLAHSVLADASGVSWTFVLQRQAMPQWLCQLERKSTGSEQRPSAVSQIQVDAPTCPVGYYELDRRQASPSC